MLAPHSWSTCTWSGLPLRRWTTICGNRLWAGSRRPAVTPARRVLQESGVVEPGGEVARMRGRVNACGPRVGVPEKLLDHREPNAAAWRSDRIRTVEHECACDMASRKAYPLDVVVACRPQHDRRGAQGQTLRRSERTRSVTLLPSRRFKDTPTLTNVHRPGQFEAARADQDHPFRHSPLGASRVDHHVQV